MKIDLIVVGAVRDRALSEACAKYAKRAKRYARFREIELKAAKPGAGALGAEAERMRARARAGAVRIALDERGAAWSSREFARRLQEWMNRSVDQVALFIGSASGLDPRFRDECEHRWALGPITMPHELARLVVTEQIYRAHTILRGEPYHKD